ncbi:hypothetical protein IMZ48_44200 [Candidatus Bathyarchaeota archaeon]|nr:hypothetical protein [Candidatus Bathyarchaeota archaeon]
MGETTDIRGSYDFAVTCALPYLDTTAGNGTDAIDRGVACGGCYLVGRDGDTFRRRNTLYSRDEFLEHFRWCEKAQLLWRDSNEGERSAGEMLDASLSIEFLII